MNRSASNACPSEDTEQTMVIRWSIGAAVRHPELALLHAIPNGGHRAKRTAELLKATGVKPGVPDLCLPVARGGYHGLYVEMKRRTGGRVSPEQREWARALAEQGYCVAVCRGYEAAICVITDYLEAA